MRHIFYVLMLVGGVVAFYFALNLLLWQDRANRVFVPVDARILSAEVKRHSGKNTTYSPEISYRYTYNGREYTSSQVLTVSQSSSRSWAQEIVDRYGGPTLGGMPEFAQRKATAYVDPDKPEEAILVKDYSFVPYLFTLFGGIVGLLGIGLMVGVVGGGRKEMAAVALDETQSRLLLPTQSLQKRWTHSLMWLIGAGVIAVPLAVHWAMVAGMGWSVLSLIIMGGVATLAAIAWRRWTLTRHLSDARLKVTPAPMVRGGPLALQVEADVFTPLKVSRGRMRVICTEHYREKSGNKTRYGTRNRGEKVVEFCTQKELAAGSVLEGSGEVYVGQELPPTSDLTIKTYPYYTWEVRVEVAIEQHADYCGVFPLEVD